MVIELNYLHMKMKKGQHFIYGKGYGQSTYVFDRMDGADWLAHPVEAAHQVYCFKPEQQAEVKLCPPR